MVHGGTGTAEHDWAVGDRPAARSLPRHHDGHARPRPLLRPRRPSSGIDRFGLDLVHVMRAMGVPRAVLVGFSVGANTLLKLVSTRPDLALGLVTIGASVAGGDASRVAADPQRAVAGRPDRPAPRGRRRTRLLAPPAHRAGPRLGRQRRVHRRATAAHHLPDADLPRRPRPGRLARRGAPPAPHDRPQPAVRRSRFGPPAATRTPADVRRGRRPPSSRRIEAQPPSAVRLT